MKIIIMEIIKELIKTHEREITVAGLTILIMIGNIGAIITTIIENRKSKK